MCIRDSFSLAWFLNQAEGFQNKKFKFAAPFIDFQMNLRSVFFWQFIWKTNRPWVPATCSRCSNHCPWTSCFINMHIDRVNKTVQKIWAVAFESLLIRIFLCELVTVLLPRKRTIDWLQDLELEQALSPQLRFHEQSFDSFRFKNNTCAFFKKPWESICESKSKGWGTSYGKTT